MTKDKKRILIGVLALAVIILVGIGIYAIIPFASSPLWTGVLNNQRAVDWNAIHVGVIGGIPSANWPTCSTSACTAVASPTASITQINSAITSAPNNSVVLLGSGTYNLSSAVMMKGNVVLRGQNPTKTTLRFTGSSPCNGQGAHVCFIDSTFFYYGSQATAYNTGSNSARFCGTGSSASCSNVYTQGSNQLQLADIGTAGLSNGQWIILDEENDYPNNPSTTTGPLICDMANATDGCSVQGQVSPAPGRCATGPFQGSAPVCGSQAGHERNQIQMVQIKAGCSSPCSGAGPFPITVDNGLYTKTWTAAKHPGVWWTASNMTNAGIENLTVDNSQDTSPISGIMFQGAYNDWVLNVASNRGGRNHVWMMIAGHIQVQNSYFYATATTSSQSYALEPYYTDASLLINNIFQQVTQPVVFGAAVATVFAHNFSVYDRYETPAGWLQQQVAGGHDAGTMLDLIEGNEGQGYWNDVFHGTGWGSTVFRNVLLGWQSIPPTTMSNTPVQLLSFHREYNFIGNVEGCDNNTDKWPGNCGTPYHKAYITNVGVGAAGSIYDFNGGNRDSTGGCSPECIVKFDPYVQQSVMLWGNYDTSHRDIQWNASEVPTGLSDGYSVTVPSSHTLPPSFFEASKPAWWPSSGVPWPAIGPDVTGGGTAVPGSASHAMLNPAALCYFSMHGTQDGSGPMLSFDPSACYSGNAPPIPPDGGGGGGTPPPATATTYSGDAVMSGKVTY